MSTQQEEKLTLEDLVKEGAKSFGITTDEEMEKLISCIQSDEFKKDHDKDIKKIESVLKKVNEQE